jgi:hypothetical protein
MTRPARPEVSVPGVVLRGVAPSHRPRVAAWWRRLDAAARADLVARWGRPRCPDEPAVELLGVFVDDATERADELDNAMWSDDFREYVTAHDELVFHVPARSFHICRAHPAARAVVARGVIPAGFACPLGRAGCPFVEAASGRPRAAMHLVPLRIGTARPQTRAATPAAPPRLRH